MPTKAILKPILDQHSSGCCDFDHSSPGRLLDALEKYKGSATRFCFIDKRGRKGHPWRLSSIRLPRGSCDFAYGSSKDSVPLLVVVRATPVNESGKVIMVPELSDGLLRFDPTVYQNGHSLFVNPDGWDNNAATGHRIALWKRPDSHNAETCAVCSSKLWDEMGDMCFHCVAHDEEKTQHEPGKSTGTPTHRLIYSNREEEVIVTDEGAILDKNMKPTHYYLNGNGELWLVSRRIRAYTTYLEPLTDTPNTDKNSREPVEELTDAVEHRMSIGAVNNACVFCGLLLREETGRVCRSCDTKRTRTAAAQCAPSLPKENILAPPSERPPTTQAKPSPRWVKILALLAVMTAAYHADTIIEASKQKIQEVRTAWQILERAAQPSSAIPAQAAVMSYCEGCNNCGRWACVNDKMVKGGKPIKWTVERFEDGREYGYIQKAVKP